MTIEWDSIRNVRDFVAWLSETRAAPYRRSLDEARREVAGIDPQTTAKRSGAAYQVLDSHSGMFTLPFLGQRYTISYPDFKIVALGTGQEPSVYRQVIVLHYLKAVDDSWVPTGFVDFGALSHGRPYLRSLQKTALEPLARAYVDNPNHFRLAAQALGGRPLKAQDSPGIIFSFWPLPRLPMGVSLLPGDGEFPIRAQLFIDINTERWLPIYDTAITARLLCQTLARLKPVGGRAVELSAALAQDDGALYGAAEVG